MYISVIIPVYNADKYVTQAVESALSQPETGEIILIEDASPDNALQICQLLAKKYSKVKLLRHPDGKNHGAGASRNLGIKNAQFDYIAFLDADDFYLPERFTVAQELLEKSFNTDGIYEAIGTHFNDEEGKKKWFDSRGNCFQGDIALTTLTKEIEPELLFKSLLEADKGWFHANGIVVRKSIFERTGYFNEFELCQDADMWLKMSLVGTLRPGRLKEPVAMRRVHSKNRVSASKTKLNYYHSLVMKNVLDWTYKKNMPLSTLDLAFKSYISKYFNYSNQHNLFNRNFNNIKLLIKTAVKYPRIILLPSFIGYLNFIFKSVLSPIKNYSLNKSFKYTKK